MLGWGQEVCRTVWPEQRRIMRLPDTCRGLRPRDGLPAVPTTVADPAAFPGESPMSLNQAICIALENTDVIRVLGGSSGRTIFDPAVTNTQIDQARGRFDPTAYLENGFNQTETPGAAFDPTAPGGVVIGGPGVSDYDMRAGVRKINPLGGTSAFNVGTNPLYSTANGLPLNPRIPSVAEFSYTQPLLRGGGLATNLAPVEIARLDTERSFFQMKDAVQEMVRGVVEAYWALVFARTDLWSRRQQVRQGQESLDRAKANLEAELGDISDVAQAQAALANFKAALITSQANVFDREATLRNILGLQPALPRNIVPTTPPTFERAPEDWDAIMETALARRPDLIELQLIIEADTQRLAVANNDALPDVDAVGVYRWNGLEGRTPDQTFIRGDASKFTDWQLGVNFSVPLGLRESRAGLRQRELILMRDRANLEQAVLDASHDLAANYRNLARYYEQYLAYKENRAAAEINLDVQFQRYRAGFDTLFLNVLQAITEWGNAVRAEAQALLEYNTELARLSRQTGTILEAHNIRFTEERYASVGPLGRIAPRVFYPRDTRPTRNADIYPDTEEPSENAFDLVAPHVGGLKDKDGRIRIPSLERIPKPDPETP